jgi:molybdopterin converting factor subunit 1
MKILFFARARDLAGAGEIDVDMPPGGRVADLRRVLAERFPTLTPLLPHCAVAVNDDYASDDTVLTAIDRVALLPPVSGG